MASVRASLLFSFADRYGNLVINIISTVALARLLSPVETGLYSIAAGLINIAQSFREFGISTYILQERDLTREKLASATGGRLNPSPAEVSTERATLERRVSMNPYLLVAAMILLIGEALVRRLTT